MAVQSLRRDGKFWVVNEQLKTPLLVGAGGHQCPVARQIAGEHDRDERIVAAQEVEFFVDPARESDYRVEHQVPQLYFCDDLKGYGWCFRKGPFLNIGLGREDKTHLGAHLAGFVQNLKRRKVIPADAEFAFKGHAYLLYSHALRPLVNDGVLLIGDAAGIAYTESGEGILPSIESGLFAAETVLAAGGHYEKSALLPYETIVLERFGSRSGATASIALPEMVKRVVVKGLMATHWFVRGVVLDRWFLHARKPALVPVK